jgi:hypothetical protein
MAGRAAINIPITADPAPAEAGFSVAADAAEKYTVKVAALADKNVQQQVKQYAAIQAQAKAYANIARSAESSSVQQVAALKLVGKQFDKLARSAGADSVVMQRALEDVRDSAMEASGALGDVKLGAANAAETDAVAGMINDRLDSIAAHAALTRTALAGVGLSSALSGLGFGRGGLLGAGFGGIGNFLHSIGRLFSGGGGGGGGALAGIGGLGGGVAGLAGFGPERILAMLLGLGGSLGGASLGGGLLGLGALGTTAVGMGTDMAGIGQAAGDIKTITGDVGNLNTAIKEYGKHSAQAAAATKQLNTDLGGFSKVAKQAVYNAAQTANQFHMMFNAATGEAEKTGAKIIQQAMMVGEKFLPTIGKFAAQNMGIIKRQLQPFFSWLTNPTFKGPGEGGGLGIFTNLEKIFQKNLPRAVHAGTQAFELLAKTIDIAAQHLGGLTKWLDKFLTRMNGPDFKNYRKDINALINMFEVWMKLLGETVGLVIDVFKAGAGFGTDFAKQLTSIVKLTKDWLEAKGMQDTLHSLFAAHKAQIDAIFHLIRALLPDILPIIELLLKLEAIVTRFTVGPLNKLADAITYVNTNWQSGLKAMERGFASMVNYVIGLLDHLINSFNTLFGWIHKFGTLNMVTWGNSSGSAKGPWAGQRGEAAKILQEGTAYGGMGGGTYASGGGHGGPVNPKVGSALDCSGFIYQSLTAAGVRGFSDGRARDQYLQCRSGGAGNWHAESVGVGGARPGDIVYWNNGLGSADGGQPGHCGIVARGSGSSAICMQYKDVKEGSGLGPITEYPVMGVFRIVLIKSRGSHHTPPSSTPPLPNYQIPKNFNVAPGQHATPAQHAAAIASHLAGPSVHAERNAAIALAHATSAMSGGHYLEAYNFYKKYLEDQKKALADEEREEKQLRAKIKASSGAAKREYERALKDVQRNINATQVAIINAGKDMAKATADQAKKVAQQTANILTQIETAADAQFQAEIAPLQAQLDAMQQQDQTQSDAQAIQDAQKQLNQDLLLGNVAAIIQDYQTLTAARRQQQEDELQQKINAIQTNEDNFNKAIEKLIAQIEGGPKSLGQLMKQLGKDVGTTSAAFKALLKLLQQAGIVKGGGGGGGSGGGGHEAGSSSLSVGGLTATQLVALGKAGFGSAAVMGGLVGGRGHAVVIPGGHHSSTVINVTVNGVSADNVKSFARTVTPAIRRELLRTQNRNTSLGFVGPRGTARA